jgi:ElaB/YqjD/DUF883 family membrane-anchored ribosome-binding protein
VARPENTLRATPLISRELKSLREEAAAAQRDRQSQAADRASASDGAVAAAAPIETAEEREMRDQLGEFVDQVAQFFDDAEKNIAAHPIENVVGALLIGILIGRLIGRH